MEKTKQVLIKTRLNNNSAVVYRPKVNRIVLQ